MLTVSLKVEGRIVGTAEIANIGEDARLGTYRVKTYTFPNKFSGSEPKANEFVIENHERFQTPWALIEKVAAEAARLENAG